MLDEMSLGLAPIIVEQLLPTVRNIADERGMAVLLVEQHARKALRYADRVYVMRRGRIEMALGARDASRRIAEIENVYLAMGVTKADVPTSTNNRSS
jgi:branched-chain amino acid transport system ATP-binding protein